MRINKFLIKTTSFVAMLALLVPMGLSQQPLSSLDRESLQVQLQHITSNVRKYYFDPKLHGVDWNAKVQEAKEKITTATSVDAAILEIAAALDSLNDPHTYFVPLQDSVEVDYGVRFQMVGDRCYITQVRPGSDAESKGLRPGDEVLTINGATATRATLPKIEYVLNVLLPRASLTVDLWEHLEKRRTVNVKASVRHAKVVDSFGEELTGIGNWELMLAGQHKVRPLRPRYRELNKDLMVLKLPVLLEEEMWIQELVDKARKHSALIVDLRDNSWSALASLQYLLGDVFDKDLKIADRVSRETTTSLVAKSNRNHVFTGKLIVLVDSGSASAAELFASLVQREKRGTVLGDHTPGLVMQSKYYGSAAITEADLVMANGKSLEHVGVTPDETMLPSAEDLAKSRDPVMARAAEIAGVTLSPEEAGKLFPYEWPKD